MSDAPPIIPTQFQIYDSYAVDPTYQRKFSIVWASVAAVFVLASLPTFVWSLQSGRIRDALFGIHEDVNTYEPISNGLEKKVESAQKRSWMAFGWISILKAPMTWTVPLTGLDIGQIVLVVAYYVTVVLCIVLNAELIDNPNRAGFLAIAQLPPVFLFATKNSPLGILLSSGYEKLNFLHRWCSRGTLLAAAVHGALWIRNHREYGVQILGAQKETSGIAAFALLCILALSSLRPVRISVYQVFRLIHLLVVPSFVITLCYHTIYVAPYVYPVLAFYGFDLLLRLARFRAKDATLIAPDTQMTIIRVHDCTSGWSVGQHVRLRIFIANRMFESHPLTIMNAPLSTTCYSDIGVNRELILGARVKGNWTRALNTYARENIIPFAESKDQSDVHSDPTNITIESEVVVEDVREGVPVRLADLPPPSKTGNVTEDIAPEARWSVAHGGAPVQVMLDGPYGGCSLDLGAFERVLLFSGGSGVTFALALLDDIVGRCSKLGRRGGEVTRRVEFAWCIRSFGALNWVAPLLLPITSRAATPESTLDLHISVYVTCLCKPDQVPLIPNCDVLLERPSVRKLVDDFAPSYASARDEKSEQGRIDWSSLAICTAGPESLINETRNTAARLALRNPTRRIKCHAEAYFL